MANPTFYQSPEGGKIGADVNILSGDPIPVFIVDDPAGTTPQVVTPVYNEITSVPASVNTELLSYIVPISKDFYLLRVEVSGSNIAQFQLQKNGVTFAMQRTYFGDSLNASFEFQSTPSTGIRLVAGDNLKVFVEHFRPTLGDFEATAVGLLVG